MDCQIAWALSLAIYVKAGRTPWILSGLRTDTAFAGIGYSVDHIKTDNQTLIGCSHIYGADGKDVYKRQAIERSFCRSGAGRLYWCGYGRNIAPEVRVLIEKLNLYGREAFYIPTDGFDKTMLNIEMSIRDSTDTVYNREQI